MGEAQCKSHAPKTTHAREDLKRREKMKNFLSKFMIVMALGAIITMPGIVSCKKANPGGTTTRQIYPGPAYAGQNLPGGHAPIPGTLLLVGSGLVGLGLLRWKNRSKP
jgi:hypothetical protein